MSEQESNIKRRDYVKAVGAGVAGLAVGAAGGWYAGSKSYEEAYKAAVKDLEAAGYKKPPEVTKITTIQNTFEQAHEGPINDRFQRENPGISLATEWVTATEGAAKIAVALQQTIPPDVIKLSIDPMRPYSDAGLLYPLDEYVKTLEQDFLGIKAKGYECFTQLALDVSKYKEKMYIAPTRLQTWILGWNKNICREKGVLDQMPPKTWDDFVEVCQKLNDPPNLYAFQIAFGADWIAPTKIEPFLISNGGGILSSDFSEVILDSSQSIEAFKWFIELQTKYHFMPPDAPTASEPSGRELFIRGGGALAIEGEFMIDIAYKGGLDPNALDFGSMPWPSEDKIGKTKNNATGGNGFVIPKNAAHKDLAWRYIEYNLNPIIHVWMTRCSPTITTAIPHYRFQKPYALKFINEMKNSTTISAQAPQIGAKLVEYYKIFTDITQSALLEKETPEKACERGASEIRKLLGMAK